MVQLDRPERVIGKADKLPWEDAETYLEVESVLKLPRFYVPVMDHSSGIAQVFCTPEISKHNRRTVGPTAVLVWTYAHPLR